jgi:hypothetical protein
VTWKGKDWTASLRKATALGVVSSSLTAKCTQREQRSIATNRKRLRVTPSRSRSLGRCFTSTCTKPSPYSLKAPSGLRERLWAGRRLRPSAFRMR